MTSHASRVLNDHGRETSPVIAQMAFELVPNGREGGLQLGDRPKERKEREERKTAREERHASPVIDHDATPAASRTLTSAQVGRRTPKRPTPSVYLQRHEHAPDYS